MAAPLESSANISAQLCSQHRLGKPRLANFGEVAALCYVTFSFGLILGLSEFFVHRYGRPARKLCKHFCPTLQPASTRQAPFGQLWGGSCIMLCDFFSFGLIPGLSEFVCSSLWPPPSGAIQPNVADSIDSASLVWATLGRSLRCTT